MPSNIATIPGLNPVPLILMTAPPTADPAGGRISVTAGAAPGGVGMTGEGGMTDGEVGNPDD
jgi:hypothetical protein